MHICQIQGMVLGPLVQTSTNFNVFWSGSRIF